MKFIKPEDLVVIENNNEFILRKGFIHVNEVTIDKNGSSPQFVQVFEQFVAAGSLDVREDSDIWEDFRKLAQFYLIDVVSPVLHLLVGDSTVMAGRFAPRFNVMRKDAFISHKQCVEIVEGKNPMTIDSIIENVHRKLNGASSFYYIDALENLTDLRAVNRLACLLDMQAVIGCYDDDNVYFTRIMPGYTGCFECLERHIISKFPGVLTDYISKRHLHPAYTENSPAALMLDSWILQDADNIDRNGDSSMLGKVLHFSLRDFEYSCNENRRYVSCPACAGRNMALFEEQNERAVNVLEEAKRNAIV